MKGNATLNAKFLEAAVPMLEAAEGLDRCAWFADRWETAGATYNSVTLFNNADNRLPEACKATAKNAREPHCWSPDATACCVRVLLTCARLMTSPHSKGRGVLQSSRPRVLAQCRR